MTEKEIEMKAYSIFEMLEPALNRDYINGSWKYKTSWGIKTKEGILESIKTIIKELWL